jgi:DNA-directed RNA polymerase specialized sigma24 family protein
MNATRVVTGRNGRVRTLNGQAQTSDPGTTWFRTVGRHEIDRAYRLAGFILGDAREAEDATQDALARAWRQGSSLRHRDSAQAWFDRILVNVCRDRLRQRRPRVRWAEMEGAALPRR